MSGLLYYVDCPNGCGGEVPCRSRWPAAFATRVNVQGPTPEHRPDLGPCWLWTGSHNGRGYGEFRVGRKKHYAHRLAYQWCRGPIPEGRELDHLCHTPSCLNPWHLEAVSHRVNVLRGESPWAASARRTHCPSGHALAGENILWENGGTTRRCRMCKYKRNRSWAARNENKMAGYKRDYKRRAQEARNARPAPL